MMPSDKATNIIENTICGIENLWCQPFPKRAGYIISYGDQIDALVADAVNAERERCAKVAEDDTSFDMLQDFGMQSHSAQLRANIAEAIRNPAK